MVGFGSPWLLLLLAAAPLAVGLLALGEARRRRALVRFLGGVQAGRLVDGPRGRWLLRAAAAAAALALLAVAAAQPQRGTQPSPAVRRGADVVVVLDVSLSMNATDVQPNRMAHAQEHLVRALDRLQGDRVGLVIFAGSARLRFPLTTDTGAAQQIIRLARPGDPLVGRGTAIGPALAEAARLFDEEESPAGRAVVLVTDGEDLQQSGSPNVAELTRRNVALFTVGVGTPEGSRIPVPGRQEGSVEYRVDPATGEPAVSRLDEPFLENLARAGGGRYFRLGPGDDLSGLVSEIDRLEAAVLSEGETEIPVERFQWALAPALALLLLELLAPAARRLRPTALRRLRPGTAAPLLVLAAAAALWAASCGGRSVESLNREGNRLYDAGQYEEALETYRQGQVERPDLPQFPYNIGNVLHRLGQYDRAVEETRRALTAGDPELRFRAYYALGNHYFHLGRYSEAYEAYKGALRENPSDLDAKTNLELALLQMQAQQQQPPAEGGGEPRPSPPEQGPGQELPQPGTGAPAPGGQRQEQEAEANEAVEEAVAGYREEGGIEDAIRVLDALRERQRAAAPEPSRRGSAGGRDW